MDKIEPFRLKKPIIVMILGFCFILAAPANLARALHEGNIETWYLPAIWFKLFVRLPYSQKAIIALLPVAGIALFFQRKNFWLLAIALLICTVIQNLYCYFFDADVIYSLWTPLSINGAVLVIFYFFRYPYLDKRDKIFRGISKRYRIELAVQIVNFTEGALTENLSDTGGFLRFKEGKALPAVGETIRICLEGELIDCVVIRHGQGGIGVKFLNSSRRTRRSLRRLFAKHGLQ